ncbi:hypothetical protein NLX86_06215 [Streptomyces sp. A3M-1-3]|uniref:hypothetical protein n=1 Tax=Streptomyces sp. A3M-1-3 TaxID=2962044 RepID=UPI0020B64596|nr:hypothetical protein [Streptomyces sp. A3M-1-3]MCP3817742.1 hypothetical protein [Streptomyces sp. A3M-1-3]
MNHNTPLSPRPLRHLCDVQRRVVGVAQLREHGVTAADAAERCRAGGPWQQILPGVFLLHPGPPTSEERLHATLLYAGRPVAAAATPSPTPSPTPSARPAVAPAVLPEQPAAPDQAAAARPRYGEAVITGLAALALHRFASAPPLISLDRIDVLVPRTRRLRSTGFVRLVRTQAMPDPEELTGVPVAPVARALADAVGHLADANAVRRLLTEAVRGGHCEATSVVRELTRARLLNQPHVVDAVDSLVAEGRAIAEDRLYEMVRAYGLPDPLWNVDLRLPGGPHLGGVDAYWPDQAVAVELDTRASRQGHRQGHRLEEDAQWSEVARKREHLERLGITVVHITPRKLRDAADQQAAVVRTALMASGDRDPAAYVVVLPR